MNRITNRRWPAILAACLLLAWLQAPHADTTTTALNFVLLGDTHGHMNPRPNLRRDGKGGVKEGGYAYLKSRLDTIRQQDPDTVLFMAGDTLQGGVEALYTAGQSAVDIFDLFGIDVFAPGNWDFLYGRDRFMEVFGDGRWGIVTANAYLEEGFDDPATRQRLVEPYRILERKGIKIGIIGLTAERGILAVPSAVQGLVFTRARDELPELVAELRPQVDVLVLLSELGLAKNSILAEEFPEFDLVFSSDQHEEAPNPIVLGPRNTLVTEMGHDGTALIHVVLKLQDGEIMDKIYNWHDISRANDTPDTAVQRTVRAIQRRFNRARGFSPHVNPISGFVLETPADTLVGHSRVRLYRYDFTDDPMPGVVEGTSHDFLTDAFRTQTGSDVAMIVGFRYGDHVRPGPIRLRDLYHYLPAGAQIARGTATGAMIASLLENQTDGALNKDPFKWTGGWIFGYSGLMYQADLTLPKGSRVMNVKILRQATGLWEPLDPEQTYTFAGFWFPELPDRVGVLTLADVQVLTREGLVAPEDVAAIKDATEVVVDYLRTHDADPMTGRVELLSPLPPPVFGNPEVQPLRGATLE